MVNIYHVNFSEALIVSYKKLMIDWFDNYF